MKLPRAQIYLTLYSCWINYLIINFLSLGWNSSVKHLNSLVPLTATWIWWKNKEIVDVQNPKLEEKKNQHKTMQVVIASAVSINVGIAW